jgi:hypothetical protein
MLFPPAGKIFDRGKDPAQQFGGRNGTMRIAKLMQPLDSELFYVAVEGVRNSTRSRRFNVARTSCSEVPVLCTPRNVPTASAAYSAAGRPLPETSPR